MPDKYEIRTQYMPALLCSAPFIAFGFYFLGNIDTGFWGSVLGQAVGGISMTAALYYLAAFICRHVGKWIEEKLFANGLYFPTTDYLIENSRLCSAERQQQIRDKIKAEFDVDLSARYEDTEDNRRRIHEAVGAVRKKFFRKSENILQRNIQFGFAKNLAGGAIVSTVVSIALVIMSLATQSAVSLDIALVLTVGYTLLAIFGLFATKANSVRYAHTLFDEYLGS